MKILVIDGYNGTWVNDVVRDVLEKRGMEAEWVKLSGSVQGCIACGKCNRRNRCVYEDDVNRVAEEAEEICSVLVLCPLYYGRPDNNVVSFVTRLMRSASRAFAYLPCAVLYFSRLEERKHVPALDTLLEMGSMFILHEQHGNVVYGEDRSHVEKTCDVLCWMADRKSEGTKPALPEKVKDFVR